MFSSTLQFFHQILNSNFFHTFLPYQILCILIYIPLQQDFIYYFHPTDINFLRRCSYSLFEIRITFPSLQTIPQVSLFNFFFLIYGLVFSFNYLVSISFAILSFIRLITQQCIIMNLSKSSADYEQNFIKLGPFLFFMSGNIALILGSFLLWRLIWSRIERLSIKNIKLNTTYRIGSYSQISEVISHLRVILRNILEPVNYLTLKCGFEAYTFIYFQRCLALTLMILFLTDICMWIPYQLFFNPLSQFSLVTMTSGGNQDFRTFYTIWAASIILYSMNGMLHFLKIQLCYILYKNPAQRAISSLKSRTLHVNFLGQKYYDPSHVKSQIQEYMVDDFGQQDRIVAILPIPNYSVHLELEYKLKIVEIVQRMGVDNMTCLWKFFKKQSYDKVLKLKDDLVKQLLRQIEQTPKQIEGCFIVVSKIQTAQRLCRQFQLTKAICKICPDIWESEDRMQESKLIVKWAQNPNQIQWINMTQHKQQILNFIIFNILCLLLLIASFAFIAISSSTLLQLPRVIAPLIVVIVNSSLRWLISKMVEWEQRLLRSQSQIKEFRMLCIYFFINVILGSIVRDALNLVIVLETGWGFIQLLQLIYLKIDGYFYYLFIFTQTAISFMDTLVKPGQIFADVFQADLYYQKVRKIKQKSIYAKNDSFRYGYSYAIDFIVLAVILLYSVSNPLIHLFGIIYFFSRYHLNTYTLVVFHEEEVGSNMRLIIRVVEYIFMMMSLWIFLTATSLIFDKHYSNSIILYIFCGVIMYYGSSFSKQLQTTHPSSNIKDLQNAINTWSKLYQHPFNPSEYKNRNHIQLI